MREEHFQIAEWWIRMMSVDYTFIFLAFMLLTFAYGFYRWAIVAISQKPKW